MRALFADLLGSDAVNRLVGGMVSGLATRYDLGSDDAAVGKLAGDGPAGATTLYEAMADGSAVLLDAGGRGSRLASALAPRLRCIAVAEGPSRLVRPDGCVAWQGDDLDALAEATRRWFGGGGSAAGRTP